VLSDFGVAYLQRPPLLRPPFVVSRGLRSKTMPSVPLNRGVVLLGDVVLSQFLGGGDQGDLFSVGVTLNLGDECPADRVQEGREVEGIHRVGSGKKATTPLGLESGW
jgi:hypothetical protein